MTNGPKPSPRNGFTLDLGDAGLTQRVTDGMAAVETLLRERLNYGEDFITEKVNHLAFAGGKRFRPVMALLCSEFGPNPGAENVIKGAVLTEMVHLATLYHDDVMDEADRRRGVASANARWNNSVAILAGDILLAHTSRLMSEIDTGTVAYFADTFQTLVTGQMRETEGARGADEVQHYLKVVEEKTGVLIAGASYLGAKLSGADAATVASCERMGAAVGVVFQIVDDIIDIFSDPAESGKTPGTDLREGVFTLPVLYALEEDSPAGEELRRMLTGPLTEDADVERALALLRESNGRERALETVREYLAAAERELDLLEDGPANHALRSLVELTVSRVG
ncbi:polyprenyl synthetase family protein [Corynebacterium aquatimens]|uniref:polyprenyl synthetase family protein n=1 Tax=Corynebacterium TaxID=1716 RepID=UPI001F1D4B79|nr:MULTISPECIES: polyprenyl synthetase family protein [Corynebacterium]QYH20315.1 polyprenyl synthetase family protein [Corynebacterium aquatimens]UIZ92416.1 polyprenyl synthetase family protein [Corynebacterium sp. CNCTC7651]